MTTLQGTYNNMPVIFHQRDGQTVKITPGRFCPACQDTRFERTDDGDRQCRTCQRVYYVPTQGDIDQFLAHELGLPNHDPRRAY